MRSSFLLALLLLGACETANGYDEPQPRRQALTLTRPADQRKPASMMPMQNNGYAQSRLQAQPWPPGMGRPLAPSMLPPPGSANAAITHSVSSRALPSTMTMATAPKGKAAVAILLPLSGKNAALGQAMLNAAQMAVFDLAAADFELMPRDTRGTPDGAAKAAEDAIASGAQLLIGPLFAADVAAVKPVIADTNVNMLALSTDISLGASGSWVMGFAPAPQVERVLNYARRQGLYRFAAIIPNTPYGVLVRSAFENTLQDMVGTSHTILDSVTQYTAFAASLKARGESLDALFLPLGGDELRTALEQLKAAGFDNTRTKLLGTGLWDEPGLGQRVDQVIGGWYAAAEPEARERFNASYSKTYNVDPPRLATLAYDATALAAALSQRGGSFDRSALTNPNGFAGLDGIFRLTPQGTAERGLAINEVLANGNRVIDPSPSTFAAQR